MDPPLAAACGSVAGAASADGRWQPMTTQDGVLALAGGAALVASGGALATGPRRRHMALLMVATGVTWWLGGLGDWSLVWHRGPMTPALLA